MNENDTAQLLEKQVQELIGTVERIVFHNPDTGFTVIRLKLPKQSELTTAVGKLPPIRPAERICATGFWRISPTHGRQFEIKSCAVLAPADLLGLQKYLGSGLINGVGPAIAKRIIDKFGAATLDIIENKPDELRSVEGIGAKRVDTISSSFKEHKVIRELLIYLQRHHISPTFAHRIFKVWGKESIARIEENPYLLAQDIHGIGFKTADKIAASLGIAKDSPMRIESGLEFLLTEQTNEGHSCTPRLQLIEMGQKSLEVNSALIEEALARLLARERIFQSCLEEDIDYLWLKSLYLTELGIAKELLRLNSALSSLRSIDTTRAIEWVEKTLHIQLADKQKEAVVTAFSEKILIITGGPGTGKSTITRTILSIASKLTRHIFLAAPTGKAAKRLTEITRREAHTLHSLLQYDLKAGGFRRNRENPLNCDLLIVDEASMIDTRLIYHLLRALKDETRLIIVGDVDQLPSIGAGAVLSDLICSNLLPTVRLNQIFRQAAHSKIITNAHRINEGLFPDLKDSDHDFLFFQEEKPEAVGDKIVELITKTLPQNYRFNPFFDIQLLTPMKRGILGTETLNIRLQGSLNNSHDEIALPGFTLRVGDKVIQIRNNYEKEIFNGDIGRITSIDREQMCLTVNFEGRSIDYRFSELDELMLAYAISVHKYQGSESACIVCPIHTTHFIMLQRNLLYTAITRGKKLVVLVGTPQAVALALKNDKAKKRHTGLQQALKNYLQI